MGNEEACVCGHTSGWHMKDSRFTTRRYCMVSGCHCQDFELRDRAA